MDADRKRNGHLPQHRKGKHRIVVFTLFLVYFLVLFYFLFFSEKMGRTNAERAYHYNLIPFREIYRFLAYRQVLGWKAVALNIWGNILAFMPFGLFLPLYAKRCRRWWVTVLYSFELSLLAEILQLLLKVGSFDVDDLFLNTIGGLTGYLVYKAVICFRRKKREKNN